MEQVPALARGSGRVSSGRVCSTRHPTAAHQTLLIAWPCTSCRARRPGGPGPRAPQSERFEPWRCRDPPRPPWGCASATGCCRCCGSACTSCCAAGASGSCWTRAAACAPGASPPSPRHPAPALAATKGGCLCSCDGSSLPGPAAPELTDPRRRDPA